MSSFTSSLTFLSRRSLPTKTYTPHSPIPSTTRVFADDPFRARFGHKLPSGLREEARGMQWRTFIAIYAPTSAIRVHITGTHKLRGNHNSYDIELQRNTTGGRITETHSIVASGPIAACTQVLANAGRRVEILSFHQFEIFESTVTFLLASHNRRQHWAVGFGGSREHSAATAMSSASELLFGTLR
ncbi:acetyl-CoA acetyltransferase [Corynebacterium silvaticum]|uniref:Acetyl-CoA acetyltransferase n=1 Tax=Corynebacterium silvaticum TaxID=2320431 RepID=A0A7Y4P9I3_9CORY|nr:acetyl-CoA acetyltransferase [Corynebacterium silvaticum]ARU46783.1 acetyl-CoA acetyltransferase [Corynebacterium silvaticum]MBH5300827.1 acetyl-CoA acetyltransferase [Corynebacterium silvaticum]NOM65024.1 acetyl-CoA acetyltransferase [Corynebacterium silvaticum]NON70095.1 acetyl-CoA acetyltransferase [Corynebacterium silvaticum]TFA91818.1 acetyl-CoA acetyltransferase [Corynebacterium silvaticum]